MNIHFRIGATILVRLGPLCFGYSPLSLLENPGIVAYKVFRWFVSARHNDEKVDRHIYTFGPHFYFEYNFRALKGHLKVVKNIFKKIVCPLLSKLN